MKNKFDFTYLIEKINEAKFESSPFKHIYIKDFFSKKDFNKILNSTEISCPIAENDEELIQKLIDKGFDPINFPGCITNIRKYLDWHENKKQVHVNSTVEGFGMVLRLYRIESDILKELNEFLISDDFNKAISKKFKINFDQCTVDGGIQKYLDGYEISPHPDIRKKAATYMVNINPNSKSESMNHHTHYLKFKDSHNYVKEFWSGNKKIERAWVPWHWTESVKQQNVNNTIVIFSPSDDTLHAVKADYNHLITQRTQLYGNLWYKTDPSQSNLEWSDLDLLKRLKPSRKQGLKQSISGLLSESLKEKIRYVIKKDSSKVGKRNL